MAAARDGVYSVIVEAAASLGAGLWLGDRGRVVGVNNTTDFLRAVHDGALTATATPIFRGETATALGGDCCRRSRPPSRTRSSPPPEYDRSWDRNEMSCRRSKLVREVRDGGHAREVAPGLTGPSMAASSVWFYDVLWTFCRAE
ncbi:PaaI family thioesterase [Nocardia sp. AB354]|uniref:PaaI family thioesterase n=1 Tax=Nocardia sp. AB354 TaxID=3413283 RepID=UPI003C169258